MSFFKNFWKHPTSRGMYAILKGTFSGDYIVFMKETDTSYECFSLPDKRIMNVPKESFDNGIRYNLLDFVEKLPKKVFLVVEREYKNLNNKNGLRRTEENSEPDIWGTRGAKNRNNDKRQQNSQGSTLDRPRIRSFHS